jgi:hypothetical protein
MGTVASGKRILPPKVVIYGVGGIGKTSFGAAAPDPVFIFTEDGQGALDVARFEPGGQPTFRRWSDILDAVGELYTADHAYKTLVVDSIDFAEPMLWRHTADKHGASDIEDKAVLGYGKGYVYAAEELRHLLEGLDALRRDRGMAIILIAHSEIKRFESPDAESYDRYQIALQKRSAALVHDWADCLLFANWKAHIVKDEEKGQKQDRRRAVGRGERVIYTEERPAYWAKNRYSLPHELPLSWPAFIDAMKGADTDTDTEN